VTSLPYRLGLPAWAFPDWKDRYFPAKPSPLANYARVFNTVEGNTTFYHVPPADTVAGWCEALADNDLTICFKLPRTVTHERRANLADLKLFLNRIKPLQDNLGPLLLQFPARVGPQHLDSIDRLSALLHHSGHSIVLEVRHPEFFTRPELLEPALDKYSMGRVVMDTRAIFQGNRQHPEVLAALHDKPDLPVIPTSYNNRAFIRFMLHPDRVSNQPYIDDWATRVAGDLQDGVDVTMMIHCPNNLHCPEMALQFHRALQARTGKEQLPDLPYWPTPQQQGLFD